MKLFLALTLFVLFLQPCGFAQSELKIGYVLSGGRRMLSLRDVARFYKMKFFMDQKTVRLTSPKASMSFTLKKRSAVLNGTSSVTMFPVLPGRYDAYVSEHDFRFMIEPVFRPLSLPRKKIRVILLDPGHGGVDKGAPGANGRHEKETTLAITRKVAALLHSRGFTVYMTRNSDRTLSLDGRASMTANLKPDLFISIHCNAASKWITGLETFAATPKDAPSSGDTKIGKDRMPSEPYNAQNFRLAYEIQTSLRKNVKSPDRGVKHARFYVIRNSPCPAVLIETGFISNPNECSRLFSEWGRNQVAASIANGILNYCRITR